MLCNLIPSPPTTAVVAYSTITFIYGKGWQALLILQVTVAMAERL